jgi:predicted nucleic acid-binding protein
MKAPDAIIAATALLQQAEVITRNTADFKKVVGLPVLDTQSF